MMRREMRARRRLGANSRSPDVVVTPWADEYVPAPCADLPTYPPCHAGAGGRTYLPTPPLISEVGLPTMKKHKTQQAACSWGDNVLKEVSSLARAELGRKPPCSPWHLELDR